MWILYSWVVLKIYFNKILHVLLYMFFNNWYTSIHQGSPFQTPAWLFSCEMIYSGIISLPVTTRFSYNSTYIYMYNMLFNLLIKKKHPYLFSLRTSFWCSVKTLFFFGGDLITTKSYKHKKVLIYELLKQNIHSHNETYQLPITTYSCTYVKDIICLIVCLM